MNAYDEGYWLGRAHAKPDSNLDPRVTMAHHARMGTLDEFMRGFNVGFDEVNNATSVDR